MLIMADLLLEKGVCEHYCRDFMNKYPDGIELDDLLHELMKEYILDKSLFSVKLDYIHWLLNNFIRMSYYSYMHKLNSDEFWCTECCRAGLEDILKKCLEN